MPSESPFLLRPSSDWVASNDLAFALPDAFPVSRGHTLIITRRLVSTWFECTLEEQRAVFELLNLVKAQLDRIHHPSGYNIGINAGSAAGQTVMHVHVHLIPRYEGDVHDPRGGVRGVIPDKQKYPSAPAGNIIRDSDASGFRAPAAQAPFATLPPFVPGQEQHLVSALRDVILESEGIDMVSAFVQPSGLGLLHGDLVDALKRGAAVRILTGDYLAITSADALVTLLELAEERDRCEVRVHEVSSGESFHPKAYVFIKGQHGAAYVGSSNLTGTALTHGIEWNLRLVSSSSPSDRSTFQQLRARFDALWSHPATKPLTKAWIDAYRLRAPVPTPASPEPRTPPPTPHPIQTEALKALEDTRGDGKAAGLVVLATGLGKTYLSAFDFRQLYGRRALFLAHREEILGQAREAWAKVFPDRVLGRLAGGKYEVEADVLFASVQTLSRERHYTKFDKDHFDYIVVDEFHHASAKTYRTLLTYFAPRFTLGLTATPDRMDGASLLELCGENLVYQQGLLSGISRKLLVPFQYFGVKDRLDFAPIPWRSGRFDPQALTLAVETQSRAEQALEEYRKHAPPARRKALVFCVSQTHADYMAEFFNKNGHAAASVHSGPTSAPRSKSLRELEAGELEMICAVDIFNEGLDVPAINTVLMLRPTASPIIFLQQVGRGLRPSEGKPHLTVIDFIGNHRTFLQRPQALVYLTGREATGYESVRIVAERKLELPEGCSVEIEIEAINMLEALARKKTEDTLVYEYGLLRDTHGRRPTATELLRALGMFGALRKGYTTYFDFVKEQGDLSEEEARVLGRHRSWFADLMKTQMSKSFKMIALEAMLDADAVPGTMTVADNAKHSNALIRRQLLLYREMKDDSPGRAEFGEAFVREWRKMPLSVWAKAEGTSERWFSLEGDTFACTIEVAAEDRDLFSAMSSELVELRLAEHLDGLRKKQPTRALDAPILIRVSHAGGRPILRFDRDKQNGVPELGEVAVEVAGEPYKFHFRKIAVNKVVQPGSDANVLPQLMRAWFGATAGHPGTKHFVVLEKTERGYRLRKEGDDAELGGVSELPEIPYFEDMKVACGAFELQDRLEGASRWIHPETDVAVESAKHFVVRASGASMDGGERPIKDGDLVLCEWFDGRSAEEVEGAPTLLMGVKGKENSFAALKVPRRVRGRWQLESWNPKFVPEPIEAGMKLEPIARVLGVVKERTELVLWGSYRREDIARAFGCPYNESWKKGYRPVVLDRRPHSILMVTLDKGSEIRNEEHYQERFISPTEFQWESPNAVDETRKEGRDVIHHGEQGRTLHLFVRLSSKVKGESQPFLYCGAVTYLRHKGAKPMQVWFELMNALPQRVWRIWGR